MQLYQQDYGRHKKFTEADGERFVCSLYFMKILMEVDTFICPSVADESLPEDLRINGDITGNDMGSPATGVDDEGATSYAGRKNQNQSKYPGLFTLQRDANVTPMASDDWQGAEGEGNHEAGSLVNFLFVDGSIAKVRNKEVLDGIPEDHGYSLFQETSYTTDNYFSSNVHRPNIADPLTN